ncbi:recombination regulator RecX [Imbroritus primus]|uniref:Recombination regulator RecX n=1 Tax=Imbroritus primus TaxID=3058603 RepID=A0ACD3ST38_9BURK|nr:recombination regulator RecX [Burkholderiaceae bacterium PBA]
MPRPPLSLKARAVGYLSRREHSRAELARKLAPHAASEEEVSLLLDALERENWLSDTRFAQSVLHRRGGRYGTRRVMQELGAHQLDADTLAEARQRLQDTELQRARAVWRKRFAAPAEDAAARAKQVRFLLARGFSSAVVGQVVRGAKDWLETLDQTLDPSPYDTDPDDFEA